ncbi:hypothetical protein BH11BAC3_BH11BAC3_04340 [soil metagenome]
MPDSQIEKDNYIFNSIIMSIDTGIAFEFDPVISKAIARYGTKEDNLSKYFNEAFIAKYHFIPEKDFLLKKGFIKKLTAPANHYILTDKGEDVQEVGGLYYYNHKQKMKERNTFIKNIVTYGATPLIAIISTIGLVYPLFKEDKPIIIKQPITLHIDNLKDLQTNDSTRVITVESKNK